MHSDCLKIWDAKTGKLASVYRGLTNPTYELTTMILDARERKLFVGDSEGCIFTVNIKNGAKMMTAVAAYLQSTKTFEGSDSQFGIFTAAENGRYHFTW